MWEEAWSNYLGSSSSEYSNSYCSLESGLFSQGDHDWEVRYECPDFNDLETKICYAFEFTPAELEVGDFFDISNDPEDPVFYSTCYIKNNIRAFADECPLCQEAPVQIRTVFGDQCVSCETAEQIKLDSVDATWELLRDVECPHCKNG